MYKMIFPVRERAIMDREEAQKGVVDAMVSVVSMDGRVYMECEGAAFIMTANQAKDMMFSLRKAVYEAQREQRTYKKEQKGGGAR